MTRIIKKKLSKEELNNLLEWGVIRRSNVVEVTVDDIAERLKVRGISKDLRTIFRYKEKIDFDKLSSYGNIIELKKGDIFN